MTVIVKSSLIHSKLYKLPGGEVVKINGQCERIRGKTEGLYLPDSVEKYGETKLPKALWEQLLKHFGKGDDILKGFVFAEATKKSADAKAEDMKELKNGLEPINVKSDKKIQSKPEKKEG